MNTTTDYIVTLLQEQKQLLLNKLNWMEEHNPLAIYYEDEEYKNLISQINKIDLMLM